MFWLKIPVLFNTYTAADVLTSLLKRSSFTSREHSWTLSLDLIKIQLCHTYKCWNKALNLGHGLGSLHHYSYWKRGQKCDGTGIEDLWHSFHSLLYNTLVWILYVATATHKYKQISILQKWELAIFLSWLKMVVNASSLLQPIFEFIVRQWPILALLIMTRAKE